MTHLAGIPLLLAGLFGVGVGAPIPPPRPMPAAKVADPPPAPPAALAIDGPAKVDPYRLVRLRATGVPDGAALIWDVSPDDKADLEEVPGGLDFVGPPGVYRVKLRSIVLAGGKASIQTARYEVTIGGGTPQPPQPNPGPGPTPQPVSGPKYLVIIEETAAAAATRGAIFGDPDLATWMRRHGDKFRVVDKDVQGPDGNPPADVKRFLTAASGKAYPQLFIVSDKGKTIYAGDLPTDAAGLLALLKQYGG